MNLAWQLLDIECDLWIFITQRLRQIAKLNLTHIGAAHRHLSSDVLKFDVLPAALEIHVALYVGRANDVADFGRAVTKLCKNAAGCVEDDAAVLRLHLRAFALRGPRLRPDRYDLHQGIVA